jgi:hypothetical protein
VLKQARFWALSGGLALLLALTVGAQKGDKIESVGGKPAMAGEVLIKFHDATVEDVELAKLRGGIVHAKKIGGIGAYRFRSGTKTVTALLDLFAGDSKVQYVEPNYILYADDLPNDPYYPNLWGMAKIAAPGAWGLSTGLRDITVGVVDTGVDYTHPDLKNNVWTAPVPFSVTIGGESMVCPAGAHGYNALRGTFDPKDDNNHGSHVSGTIGAQGNNAVGVVGVNWSASIMGLKFLNSQGSGATSDAVDAIEFAIQAKIAGVANVRVLSNSWGGGFSTESMLEEIRRAYANDILFVCSAGNNGQQNGRNYYPATYNVPNMVVVAASDEADYIAGFSNTGHWSVHLAAPGVNVLSTVRRSSYDYYSGTSMSAPHVSGTAALILSYWAGKGFEVGVDKLRGILINSVDVVDQDPPAGYPDTKARNIYDDLISHGRLNVANALAIDPTFEPFPYFPDFVMTFDQQSRDIQRPPKGSETETYFDFTLRSLFGYEDDALEVANECCGWTSILRTFADLSVTPNPEPGDFSEKINVPLAAGETKRIRMRVRVLPSASVTQYRITIHAFDPEGSDASWPYLYHNDTAYLNVIR